MKRKSLSLVLLWIMLLLAAALYTDRDEYAWSVSGEDLAALLTTPERVSEEERAYRGRMEQEKQAARARREVGLWGDPDEEYTYADTLPALSAEGLNLMWGDYDVQVRYAASKPMSLAVVSTGRQRFIRQGEITHQPEAQTTSLRFTLTDSAEHIRLCADLAEGGAIESVTVRRVMPPVSPDLLAYAVLAGAVLSVLLVLSWDEGPEGAQRRRDAILLVGAALFASMPLLWEGLQTGHDLLFHLNRIEGIAAGLRTGQFPVRIHASTLQGYGYAAPIFYPDVFLYFPAMLRNLGVSVLDSLRVFEITINLLAAASCYLAVCHLSGSRKIALGAALLYTLSIYRLVNLYVRATLGESTAMLFFPLLIWGMAEVLMGDARRWPLLSAAMLGVVASHLLSTLFAAGFCFLGALLAIRRLIAEPRRMLALCLAAGLTALCSACFFVPMLSYLREDISTSVVLDASQHVLRLGSYFVIFSGNNGTIAPEREDFAYTIGVVPGLALLAGCALLVARRYARGRKEKATSAEALSMSLLGLGVFALLVATEAFPWQRAVTLRAPYSTFFRQLQFPWRTVSMAVPLLVMVSAEGYLSDPKTEKVGLAALLVLSVVTAGYTMQCFVQDPIVLERTSFVDSRVGQFEYTYVSTEKSALIPGEIEVGGGTPIVVEDYQKRGTDLRFTATLPEGGLYLELPLLYYPGYRASVDGKPVRVARGDNNRLRLYETRDEVPFAVHVYFQEPIAWRAAEALSLAGLIGLTLLLRQKKTL